MGEGVRLPGYPAGAGTRPATVVAPGDEIPAWRYLDAASGRPRAWRWPRAVGPLALALAVVAGSGVVAWRLPLALGHPTAATAGTLSPTLLAQAAFVHPGTPVVLPAAGRLLAVRPSGLVAAGTPLARLMPVRAAVVLPLAPPWARWAVGARGASATVPGARGILAAGLCLARICLGARAAGVADPALEVAAPAAGWFAPGWDPLAALAPAAYSDLSPQALATAPRPIAPGALQAAGAPVGVLGSAWSGVWLADIPASALPALAGAASLAVSWPGHGPVAVHLLTTGPIVAGEALAALAADALGADPPPPDRGQITIALPPVTGVILPRGAVRQAGTPPGTVVDTVAAGPGRPVPVAVLAVVGQQVVVAGLAPGTAVLARPGLARLAA